MAGETEEDNIAVPLAMVAFMAIAFYNVLELTVIAFSLFKRRSGLYFWSFLLATWGIFFHTLGFLTSIFEIIKNPVGWVTIAVIGWIPMVTGQSVVLYSRLHLLESNQTILRAVLGMIITNVFICHLPVLIIVYTGISVADSTPYDNAYAIWEKLQVTLFFLQEVTISSLYLWNVFKIRHTIGSLHGNQFNKLLRHLTTVMVVVIMLDVLVLVLEYKGLYNMQNAIKGAAYSVKLKLEFSVLNDLINLIKGGTSTLSGSGVVRSQPYAAGTASANRGEDIHMDKIGKSRGTSRQWVASVSGSTKNYERMNETGGDDKCSVNKDSHSTEASVVDEIEALPSGSSQDGFVKRGF